MTMPSQLNIVNLALGHIKCRALTSMAESSVQAVAANNCYEIARREALRRYTPPWATCVKALALNATYMAFSTWTAGTAYVVGSLVKNGDSYYRCVIAHTASAAFVTDAANWSASSELYAGRWEFAYTYPSNCVAMNLVYNEGTANKSKGEDFREVYDDVNNAKIIVTNCEDALGEYTFDLEDTTLYDAVFIKVFSYILAAGMCPALVSDDTLADKMLQLADVALNEGRRLNSYENRVSEEQKSSYEDAR